MRLSHPPLRSTRRNKFGVIRPLPDIQAFIAGEHERAVGVERLARRRRVKALEMLEGALDAARSGLAADEPAPPARGRR
jgi:hypothetical protein